MKKPAKYRFWASVKYRFWESQYRRQIFMSNNEGVLYIQNSWHHCWPLSTQGCFHVMFAPSQWETVLLCNDIPHWLGANLKSALSFHNTDNGFTSHHFNFSCGNIYFVEEIPHTVGRHYSLSIYKFIGSWRSWVELYFQVIFKLILVSYIDYD